MRTIDTPEPNKIEEEIRKRQGKGDYQRSRAYLTERKIILNLTSGPRTYSQIFEETRVQKQTLLRNLDKFSKKGMVHKHKLARGVLENHRGQPTYYILNFSDKKVNEFLNGPQPKFLRDTVEKGTKPKKHNSEYRKFYPFYMKWWITINGAILLE
jgi:hypothetical protein